MLKSAYLYMQKFDKKDHPILFESHHGFGSICMCDGGLVELANQLSSAVHVSWGNDYHGPIRIRTHAPPADAANGDTYSLSRAQKKEFEKALAKGIKPYWADERRTKEYIASYRLMRKILKKK